MFLCQAQGKITTPHTMAHTHTVFSFVFEEAQQMIRDCRFAQENRGDLRIRWKQAFSMLKMARDLATTMDDNYDTDDDTDDEDDTDEDMPDLVTDEESETQVLDGRSRMEVIEDRLQQAQDTDMTETQDAEMTEAQDETSGEVNSCRQIGGGC
jgi:hypothetical protein